MPQRQPRPSFFLFIIFTKAIGTLFAYFIFSRYTSLGDSTNYIQGLHLDADGYSLRTQAVSWIASSLYRISGSEVLAHTIFSFAAGVGIVLLIKNLELSATERLLLCGTILLPSFLIWSGTVSKESLAVFFSGAALFYYHKIISNIKLKPHEYFFTFLAILGYISIRPNYGIALAWLFFSTCVFKYTSLGRLTAATTISVLLLGAVSLLIIAHPLITDYVMPKAQDMFLTYSGDANRTWISWESFGDFIFHATWGVFASMVGPLPSEAFERPILSPFLLEGLILTFSQVTFYFFSYRIVAKERTLKKIYLTSGITTAVALILIHYPLGIFNPGSATRYRTGMILITAGLPFIFMSAARILNKSSYARFPTRFG